MFLSSNLVNSENDTKYRYYRLRMAICHFRKIKNGICIDDNGYAILVEYPDKTVIRLDLYNLPPGKHGFHIHEFADLRKGCDSLGSHYNPFNKKHGGLNEKESHLGDLGNINVDETGRCNSEIIANYLPLSGPYSVIGRSMIIHSKEDDLGTGYNEESHKTGNSGERISCGIIGYLN